MFNQALAEEPSKDRKLHEPQRSVHDHALSKPERACCEMIIFSLATMTFVTREYSAGITKSRRCSHFSTTSTQQSLSKWIATRPDHHAEITEIGNILPAVEGGELNKNRSVKIRGSRRSLATQAEMNGLIMRVAMCGT